MQFPLKASTDSCQIPEGQSCITCGIKIGEIEGFVRLTTGAILYTNRKRDTGGPSLDMDTVFSLWYHGPHPISGLAEGGRPTIDMNNTEYSLDVVEPVRGGQVDIHFCTTLCLSKFFSTIVERFDAGIKEAEQPVDSNSH